MRELFNRVTVDISSYYEVTIGHKDDAELEDPLTESSFGQHVISNPSKQSMGLCLLCGAKFFWDGFRYFPVGKDVKMECPKAK